MKRRPSISVCPYASRRYINNRRKHGLHVTLCGDQKERNGKKGARERKRERENESVWVKTKGHREQGPPISLRIAQSERVACIWDEVVCALLYLCLPPSRVLLFIFFFPLHSPACLSVFCPPTVQSLFRFCFLYKQAAWIQRASFIFYHWFEIRMKQQQQYKDNSERDWNQTLAYAWCACTRTQAPLCTHISPDLLLIQRPRRGVSKGYKKRNKKRRKKRHSSIFPSFPVCI